MSAAQITPDEHRFLAPRADVAGALAGAEAGRLYRAAREISELARVVQDAARSADAGGLPRAEATMQRIHALSGGQA